MDIEHLKKIGLYDAPIKADNNQLKKFMPYSQYVVNFLVEEPRDLKSINEKLSVFFIAWRAVVERKMVKNDDLDNYSILDARTKDGQFPDIIFRENHVKSVLGIDMVKEWVDYAKFKVRPAMFVEDFTKLPFEDNTFDIVYSYKTFGRVKDNQVFLSELCRVAKRFIFILIDDVSRDQNIQYATTTDIRFYKQWLEMDEKVIELTMAKNPVTKNQNEILGIIYKHGGVNRDNEKG
jgi:2-polyprenyl-3-methyl-5-hydroxy-6-metoxy-1,4-benzoquinol methylase